MSDSEPTQGSNPEWLESFPAATDPNPHELAYGDPVVDAIRTTMGPDHFLADLENELLDVTVTGPERHGVTFTPWERMPQCVADEITKLIHDPGEYRFSFPEVEGRDGFLNAVPLDYLHSDLPARGVLPAKPNGAEYTANELRDELVNRGPVSRPASKRAALARRERQYIQEELGTAMLGGGKRVMLYGRKIPGSPTNVARELADRYGDRPSDEVMNGLLFAAFPVPVGYTAFRVTRMLAEEFAEWGCWWCRDEPRSDTGWNKLPVMLVSTGGSLRCFVTCPVCMDEIGDGPDYYQPDGWDARHGYPCESRR
ncbi:hypothetical protein ACWDTI_25360 [Gordonia sp. NPDC003424]